MKRTEQTPNGTATYLNDDFRVYEPERLADRHGEAVTMQLCEELIEGRWEPFYAVVGK